ncbi:MAG: hypothetical protein IH592_03975 [Bacteroidales bacterium]|nr:hypothetical protein [Bacteroidales bacterium]
MTVLLKLPFFAAFMATVISLPSCSVQPCYEETDPVMITHLLTSGTGETAKADSLRVRGISPAGILKFVDARSVSLFAVTLDPSEDQSLFLITLNGIQDSAIIFYNRKPHLVSPECGYTIVSEISGLMTTHNIIDTLMIENKSVNLDGRKNLHLFY